MAGKFSFFLKILLFGYTCALVSLASDTSKPSGGQQVTNPHSQGVTVSQSHDGDKVSSSSHDSSVSSSPLSENSTDSELVTEEPDYIGQCPSNIDCDILGAECITCDLVNVTSCVYGSTVETSCTIKEGVQCNGPRQFTRDLTCRYCYQTPDTEHYCTPPEGESTCRVVSAPRERYKANCTVKSEVLCLGRRQFYKMKTCDWTSGKRWSTALILSITVGGFGADRFYLGLWKEGIGKLFSFGGLGAWTLVDVVLIATGYVGPADGSLYIF